MNCSTASFTALGTSAEVVVLRAGALPAALAVVEDELRSIDEACSRFRDDSELTRLNRSAGAPFTPSPLLLEALSVALGAAAQTDGDVDPTVGRSLGALGWDSDFTVVVARRGQTPRLRLVPAAGWQRIQIDHARGTVRIPANVEIDLGATAKALAADRCARGAHAATGASVLVNLGGDIALAGPAPDGGWPIRVTDDHRSDATAAGQTIALGTGGLATSSTTVRRWRAGDAEHHHIVEPRTGAPAAEIWRTVSVAAATCVEANTASTAAIVRGERALAWLEAAGLPARLVRRDGSVVTTGGWPAETASVNQLPVWYLMRASGVVSLLLLTLVSALGVATVSRWRPGRVPRFVTLALHRNVSLLAVAFLAVHVITAVIDSDASVGAVSVLVPAPSARYGIWLGLAALALDLIVALVITSLLRHRIAPRVWRALHYAAYLAWPVALLHGAGMGTDASSGWLLGVDAACIAAFAGAVALRLVKAPSGAAKHLAAPPMVRAAR